MFKTLLLSAMLFGMVSANADLVMKSNGDVIVLHEGVPCGAELLELAHAHGVPNDYDLFTADATVEGEAFSACWFAFRDNIGVIYEDGDIGVAPAAQFQSLKPA